MNKYRFDQIAINCIEKRKPTEADKATYVGLEHLDPGTLTVSRWGSAVPIKGEKLVMNKGDVLLGKRNAYLRRAAIAPHDGLFSAHGMVLNPHEEVIDKDFFPHFILSDYFFDEAIKISVGSLSPTINWRDIAKVEFNLPSPEKQKELAQTLWAITETIDGYRHLIYMTDELVKSQFVEMFGDPVTNPFGWEKRTLDSLSNKISDGVHAKPQYTESGKPFISVVNMNKGVLDFTDCKFVSEEAYQKMIKSTHPERGDVLYTKVGATYGIPAYVDTDQPFCLYVSVCLIKPKHELIDARFLTESMRLPYIKGQADDRIKGIGVPDLHLQEIKSFEILCPPRELQEQYVAFVEQCDKSKHEINRALDSTVAMYKKILHEAFEIDD